MKCNKIFIVLCQFLGVRFTRIFNINSNDRGYALSMEVQGTEFNTTTGQLIKDTRTWYNSHTTPTTSASHKQARYY